MFKSKFISLIISITLSYYFLSFSVKMYILKRNEHDSASAWSFRGRRIECNRQYFNFCFWQNSLFLASDGTLIRRYSRQVENCFKKIYSLMRVVMPNLHIEYEIC